MVERLVAGNFPREFDENKTEIKEELKDQLKAAEGELETPPLLYR